MKKISVPGRIMADISSQLSLKILSIFLFTAFGIHAQHEEHETKEDSTMKEETEMEMSSFFSPNLPMSRDGSGTSWQPDENPLWMYMVIKGKTAYMVQGTVYLRYTAQDLGNVSNRGGQQFDAPNMFMFMMAHRINNKNLLSFHFMPSLDPITVGKKGYPLLFQTGEAYDGKPLVDKQHPHDLFSGLAVNYTHSFSKDIDVNTYFGYPGEPALGPVMFMHRLSAMNNPDAPLGHHWQDATHISFGTGTLGIRYKDVKVEGSVFTGREPDQYRFNFDKPRFDSYSYRISANPNDQFTIQFSQGFIKSPEVHKPDVDIIRSTASVIHTKQLKQDNFISSSVIWGLNNSSENENLNSILFESNLQLSPITFYTRYEYVQKSPHELDLEDSYPEHQVFHIQALTLGLNRTLLKSHYTRISVGIQATQNFIDEDLQRTYGGNPFSAQVYLKLMPSLHHMHEAH